MAGKRWTMQEDAAVSANFASMCANEIADLLPGRTQRAVQHRAKDLGLYRSPQAGGRLRAVKWERDLASRLGEPVDEWLQRRYVKEQASMRDLLAETGINMRTLMRLMREYSITPISASEAVHRQMSRDPQFVTRLVRAGSSRKSHQQRAIFRQEHWREACSTQELAFREALVQANLSPVSEMAVDMFNIDFAFPSAKLAVELDPRWHRSPHKRPQDRRKDTYLKERGWVVLRLDARTSASYNVAKVVAALKSLA